MSPSLDKELARWPHSETCGQFLNGNELQVTSLRVWYRDQCAFVSDVDSSIISVDTNFGSY